MYDRLKVSVTYALEVHSEVIFFISAALLSVFEYLLNRPVPKYETNVLPKYETNVARSGLLPNNNNNMAVLIF
ncbi:MAG: hypothetical protein ABW185_16175, partial [Sedimenticola sp.]